MSTQLFPTGPVLRAGEDLRHIKLVRLKPQMPVHRLAQYIETSVTRRRHLVHSEKYPSPYRVSYAAAERLFGEALRFDWDGERFYSLALQRWSEHRLASTFAIRHRDLAIEAASEFSHMLASFRRNLGACGIEVDIIKESLVPLELGGIRVVDSPAVLLRRQRRGVTEVGLLSFNVSKSRPHDSRSANTAAVLLYELAGANQDRLDEIIDPSLCVVIDVFSGLIADASVGKKRRLASARLACEEIASVWPTLVVRP